MIELTRTIQWKEWGDELPAAGKNFFVICKDKEGVEFLFSEAICYEWNEWVFKTVNSDFTFPPTSKFCYWIYTTELWPQ